LQTCTGAEFSAVECISQAQAWVCFSFLW